MEAVGNNPKKGFSLIEAAFVLGVVGVVIGTIWVSAANMYESHKVNKTVEGVLEIVRNTQNLISFRDALAISNGSERILNSTMISANVFPLDWIKNNTAEHPFNGIINVRIKAQHVGTDAWIAIELFGLEKSVCIKLVTVVSTYSKRSIGGLVNGQDLKLVQVNYPNWDRTTFPISLQQAETACTSATDNFIYFYYGYTRIN